MKLSKIDVLLADLRSERKWMEVCALLVRDADFAEAGGLLMRRAGVLDELISRIDTDEPASAEKPKRTRKRKGLPASE